jgi:ribonuclease HI
MDKTNKQKIKTPKITTNVAAAAATSNTSTMIKSTIKTTSTTLSPTLSSTTLSSTTLSTTTLSSTTLSSTTLSSTTLSSTTLTSSTPASVTLATAALTAASTVTPIITPTTFSNTEFNIIQWNSRSFFSKLDLVKKFLSENNVDIMILQETWLLPDQMPTISNYRLISHPHMSGYQGLALLIKNSIFFEEITAIDLESIEIMEAKVKLGAKSINLINIYIPHSINNSELGADIKALFNYATSLENALITGDINAHHSTWGNSYNDQKGNRIANILIDYDLCTVYNRKPTKITIPGQNVSIIDVAFCSSSLSSELICKVLDENLGSDHYLIHLAYFGQIKHTKTQASHRLVIDKNTFKNNLSVINLNEKGETFFKSINKSIKKSLKKIPINLSNPTNFWSDQTKEAYLQRTLALREFNSDNTKYREYSKAEAIFKNIRRRHKRRDKRSQIENKLTSNASTTELWNFTQRIAGRLIKNKINLINENEDQALAFLDKYFPVDTEEQPIINYQLLSNEINDDNLTKKFEWEEFLRFLATRKRHSAPGHDRLSYDLIEEFDYKMKSKLLTELNDMWNQCELPEDLLKIKIIPIPKAGKSNNTIESYRPISLISTNVKIINGMLKERLYNFAKNNKLMEKNSFGFEKGISTTTCLNVLMNDMYSHLRARKYVILVFLDLSSAFDNVVLHTLEQLLLKYFPKKCVIWIMNFLRKRTIFISTNGKRIFRKVGRGLAQGDILSPFLFNLYTKIFHSISDSDTNLYQYADDLVILSTGGNQRVNMANTQYKLDQISRICSDIGMTVNASKSSFMTIKYDDLEGDVTLTLNGESLEKKCYAKHLGIWIDEKLTFKYHIKQLQQNINQRINLLKYISGFSWGAHPKILSTVYKGTIRSKLDYGCSVYANSSNTALKKLDSVNNAALRVITGSTRTTPINVLSSLAAEPPLTIRREFIIKKELLKSTYNNDTLGQQLLPLLGQNAQHPKSLIKFTSIEKSAFNSSEIMQNLDTRPFMNTTIPKNIQIHTNLLGGTSKNNFSEITIRQVVLTKLNNFTNFTILYTDASIADKKTGIGIYCKESNINVSYKLNQEVSSTTAELFAVKLAIEHGIKINKNNIVICTDSMGACQRINIHINKINKKNNKTDKLVQDILNLVNINTNHQIIIIWIPGHKNITGNEIADQLAKQGCDSEDILEIKLQLPDAVNKIKNNRFESWKNWFTTQSQLKGKYYFSINSVLNENAWFTKIKLGNVHTKIINRLLAGHTYTKKWLNIMKIENTNTCETCHDKTEDEKHLISECIKYETIRNQYQLLINDTLQNILKRNKKDELKELISFLEKAKINI